MNTEATIAEARRLWRAVGRDNLMIKVPATEAGLPAIRQLIGEGINVNITLLFSQQVYEQVVEAYLAGLEQLVAQGGDPGKIASVASFFVSRIDVAVDKLIEERLARTNDAGRARSAERACAARSRSPTPSSPISATSGCSPARAGRSCRPRARACSGCCGRAPAPRTSDYSDVLYVEELIARRHGQHHAAGDDGCVPRSRQARGRALRRISTRPGRRWRRWSGPASRSTR